LFATILARRASNNHTKRAIHDRHRESAVSLKAPLVVLWACLIAGAAVASESYRLCDEKTHQELKRLHENLQVHEEKLPVVAEVDVTN